MDIQGTEPESHSSWRGWFSGLAGLSAVMAILALTVRGTVRDAWVPASTIYYAFPLPIIALMCGFSATAWWMVGRRLMAMLASGATLGCLLAVVWCAFAWGQATISAPQDGVHRLVFWNTSRGDEGWDNVFASLRETDADIVTCVEACTRYTLDRKPWEQAYGDYTLSSMEGQMMLACRGKLLSEKMSRIGSMGLLKHCRVQLRDGETLSILLVDILSDPLRSRAGTLHELAAYAESIRDEPYVIVGDFNTPGDSIFFQSLRKLCTHAVESSAWGYAATWPLPVPVLQIDHVWGNRSIQFLRTRLASSSGSDHRMIVCELAVRDTTSDAPSITTTGTARGVGKHVARRDSLDRTNW